MVFKNSLLTKLLFNKFYISKHLYTKPRLDLNTMTGKFSLMQVYKTHIMVIQATLSTSGQCLTSTRNDTEWRNELVNFFIQQETLKRMIQPKVQTDDN